jgi:hypothetical protein
VTAPKDWQILEGVRTKLALITVANGYRTGLGPRLTLEATPESTSAQLTAPRGMLGVVKKEVTKTTPMRRDFKCFGVIEVHTPATPANARRQASDVLADIEKAFPTRVGLDDPTFPDELQELEYTSATIADRPEGQNLIKVLIQFTFTFFENR